MSATVIASPRMPQLDGVRGCAALAVLAFHGWTLSAWSVSNADGALLFGATRVLSLGWSGVDVFFTLSAFLLSLPFVEAARGGNLAPVQPYLVRRVMRILPAYWVQLLLLGLLLAATPMSMPTLLAHATLWLNIGSDPVRPLLGVWWTLPVEAGFYLLLPLLALLLRPRRWPWLLLLVLLAWGYRQLLYGAELESGQRIAWTNHLPGRIDQFVVGMLGAYAWVDSDLAQALKVRGRASLLASTGIVGFALVLAWPLWLRSSAGPGPSPHPWLFGWHGIASLSLLPLLWAAAAGGSALLGWLGSTPMRWLGAISYSLYLWHYPLMLAAREFVSLLPASGWRPLLFILLTLPACLLLAGVSWLLIERPAMRLGRRWSGAAERRRATAALR